MRTIEAIIDEHGQIQLMEPVEPGRTRRAVVVLLDDADAFINETAALSEESLQDWNRPGEDAAWSHLQPAP